MVRGDGPVASLRDLKGKRLGVAGGPLDKTWLLLLAFAKETAGIDLAAEATPVYAAPPLLTEKLRSGELDAALNYWQYCAQLEAEGFRRLLEGTTIQEHFGVPPRTPQLGYVFKDPLGERKPELVQAFARATRAADQILKTSDAEWQRLKPLVRAETDAALNAVMHRYREGIVESWGESDRRAAAELYAVLARIGGEHLVGKGDRLAPGTFWPQLSF
jgi:NitT/TauT family transport system substrate-binding protein